MSRAFASASSCQRTARHADQLAVIRSLATRDDSHDVSGYWLLTGYPYGGRFRQCPVRSSDRLALISAPRQDAEAESEAPRTHVGVDPRSDAAERQHDARRPDRRLPRQAVGARTLRRRPGAARLSDRRTGAERRPDRPSALDRRRDLVRQLDRSFDQAARSEAIETWDRLSLQAFDLVTSGRPVPPSTCARKPRRRAIATAATPGGSRACCSAADRSRRAPRSRQLGARARRLGGGQPECGTRTPRTPTACRMRSVRCSNVSFDALMDDLREPRGAGGDASSW